MAWEWLWDWATRGPLRQIVMWGFYTSVDERELKELENKVIKDKSPYSRYSIYGEKHFYPYDSMYCHEEKDIEFKRYRIIVSPNLRARLYDEGGNLLEDVPLHTYSTEAYIGKGWRVVAYIPYHPEARSRKIVRLVDGDKEIIIWERRLLDLEELETHNSFLYNKDLNCYRISRFQIPI